MIVDKFSPDQLIKLQNKFWARVDRSGGIDKPWIWLGPINRKHKGYGSLWVDGKKQAAHRVAWELINGPIPEGMQVLHKYDDPLNVNPNHLFLGTIKDNVHDMVAKNRAYIPIGEAHPRHVLNDDLVRQIRKMSSEGLGHKRIGKVLGVNPQTVYSVLRGDTWRHVV